MIERREFLAGAMLSLVPVKINAEPLRPWRIAATNLRMPTTFLNILAGAPHFKYRTLHIIGAPVSELVLGFCGWAVPSNIEVDAPVPHHYSKVAIEVGGTVVPVTFGGGRTLTVGSGVPFILSDPIPASAFGLTVFPRDLRLFVRALGLASPGRTLPGGTVAVGFDMRCATFPAASTIDDVDQPGPLQVAKGAGSRSFAPGPCLLLGRIPAGSLAVVCTGDSIADGAQDNARLEVGKGFFCRAAIGADGSGAIGSLNLTKSGTTAGTLTAGLGAPGAPGFRYRQAMLGFGNVLFDQYGANALGISTTTPAAKVVDAARALWTLARGAGVEKVLRATLIARTRSDNGFIDSAGQTPSRNWGAGDARDGVNAAFRAALAAGEIDGVVDVLGAVADPIDDHLWKTNGTAFFMTRDGSHPSSEAARRMAQILRSEYAALAVD